MILPVCSTTRNRLYECLLIVKSPKFEAVWTSQPGSTIVILPKVYLCVQNYSTQLQEVR